MRIMFCIRNTAQHFFHEIHGEDPPYDFREIPEPLPHKYRIPIPKPLTIVPDKFAYIYDPITELEYELKQHKIYGWIYVRDGNRTMKEILLRNPFYFLDKDSD